MVPKCDKCEKEILVSEGFNMHVDSDGWLAENGLLISVDGYYGGFIDNYKDPAIELRFCHDCSVALWREIPKLQEYQKKGLHPVNREESFCCEYSWTISEDETKYLFPDGSYKMLNEQNT